MIEAILRGFPDTPCLSSKVEALSHTASFECHSNMAAPMRRKQRGFGDEKTQILEITEVIANRHFGEPFGIIIRQLGICIVMGERRAYSANPDYFGRTSLRCLNIN